MSKASTSQKSSAINIVFVLFVIAAVLFGAGTNTMQEVSDASFDAAKGAVKLAIGLIGIMALWLGFMRVLEAGGLMHSLARLLRPIMSRLFPDVPAEHPAMSAMVLNMSANMLGLGNAATPFGIKAMVELNRLNPFPGTATNAMCLFLAINTSNVTLLPLGAISVRAAAGSLNPAAIFLPTLISTLCSTITAVVIATMLAKRDRAYQTNGQSVDVENSAQDEEIKTDTDLPNYDHLLGVPSGIGRFVALGSVSVFVGLAIAQFVLAGDGAAFLSKELATYWLMPLLMLMIVSYGVCRGVHVYEAVTEGAKQGFDIAIKIIPYLVAILVAVAVFRASGAMDVLAWCLGPLTGLIGMPAEVLPMALVRPLSGSGAFGVMSALVEAAPNSYSAYLASVMMGSTETTFYVLAVYFGAVGVSKVRHALVAALFADVVGIIAACLAASLFWAM